MRPTRSPTARPSLTPLPSLRPTEMSTRGRTSDEAEEWWRERERGVQNGDRLQLPQFFFFFMTHIMQNFVASFYWRNKNVFNTQWSGTGVISLNYISPSLSLLLALVLSLFYRLLLLLFLALFDAGKFISKCGSVVAPDWVLHGPWSLLDQAQVGPWGRHRGGKDYIQAKIANMLGMLCICL